MTGRILWRILYYSHCTEESAVVLKQILKTSCTHRSGGLNGDNSVFHFEIEVGITFVLFKLL